MSPKTKELFGESWPERKSPSYLEKKLYLPSVKDYIEGCRNDDGAEGLWRVHDNLYDLTEWVPNHPGGAQWLKITRGTDITEAFEIHHIAPTAENLLPNFFVRKAKEPRLSPYTFHKDGFHSSLKRAVYEKLGPKIHKTHPLTLFFVDTLASLTLSTAALSAMYDSYLIVTVAGLLLCFLTIVSHDFFHKRDNWRMYFFHFSFLSVRDWRISHVLSHHIFTNTDKDLEMMQFFPVFDWFPHEKHWTQLAAPLYAALTYPFIWSTQILSRIALKRTTYADWLCFVIPTIMFISSGQSLIRVFTLWILMNFVGSFVFSVIGLNAAHHHPDIFHQGDTPRADRDWGLNQIDAVRSNPDERNKFLVLASFGDHALHHLLPTIDHSYLSELHDILIKLCRQYNVELEFKSRFELFKGQYRQLMRTKPNLTLNQSINPCQRGRKYKQLM